MLVNLFLMNFRAGFWLISGFLHWLVAFGIQNRKAAVEVEMSLCEATYVQNLVVFGRMDIQFKFPGFAICVRIFVGFILCHYYERF